MKEKTYLKIWGWFYLGQLSVSVWPKLEPSPKIPNVNCCCKNKAHRQIFVIVYRNIKTNVKLCCLCYHFYELFFCSRIMCECLWATYLFSI